MKAAEKMGVPPWVLEQQSVIWRNRALAVMEVDNWVEKELMERARWHKKPQVH